MDEFKYLGLTVQVDGGSAKEETKRIQADWEARKKIMSYTQQNNTREGKEAADKMVLKPAMLYGMEAVVVTMGQENKMQVA